jgi:hypothetical protein
MTPEQIRAHALNQIEVNKARGEYASARCWESIASAAGQLVTLSSRIEAKRQ